MCMRSSTRRIRYMTVNDATKYQLIYIVLKYGVVDKPLLIIVL